MSRCNHNKPKIQSLSEAQQTVQAWKDAGLQVVFTNGCFDILHLGHVTLLQQAAYLGDKLVVALNSDASVQRLKGKHRPLQNQDTRTAVMAALEMVDLVVVFDEDTPLQLINTLLPDVLAKGGDWQVQDIVGSDTVIEMGGTVHSLPFVEGFSTTAVEQKILNRG